MSNLTYQELQTKIKTILDKTYARQLEPHLTIDIVMDLISQYTVDRDAQLERQEQNKIRAKLDAEFIKDRVRREAYGSESQ